MSWNLSDLNLKVRCQTLLKNLVSTITQERRHLGFLKLIPQVHLLSRWSEMSLQMEPQRFVFSCFACSCVFAPSFAVILPSFYQRETLKRSSLPIFSLVFIDADNLTMILIGGAVVLCGICLWLWSGLYDDLKSHTHNTVRTTWIWTCSRLWRWQWTFREPPPSTLAIFNSTVHPLWIALDS